MTILLILLLFVFLFFSGFMSASETALFSLSSFRLKSYKSAKDKKSKLISHLLEKPRELLVTIMMLNILFNILVQNTVSNLFGNYASWLAKVGIPLILTLFLGDLVQCQTKYLLKDRKIGNPKGN